MRPATLLVLGLLAATAPAVADGLELTPFVAYRGGGTLDASLSSQFRDDLDVEDGEAYGVTLGIPLGRSFQLELLASRQDSQLEVDRGIFDPERAVADVTVDYYHVGMLWQWPAGDVVPFFVLSGGITSLEPDFLSSDDETRPSLSMGGGVKVFVNDHLGFRFEGRGFFTDLEENDRDDRCCRYDDDDDDFTQGEARVGVILKF